LTSEFFFLKKIRVDNLHSPLKNKKYITKPRRVGLGLKAHHMPLLFLAMTYFFALFSGAR